MNSIIKSYENNFKSPMGAYAYLLINQQFPEVFVISTDNEIQKDISNMLEEKLKEVSSYEDVLVAIGSINEIKYEEIIYSEQNINRQKIIDLIENIQHIDIKNDWNILDGLIEYNNFGIFIENKKSFKEQLQSLAIEYSFKSITLNASYKGEEFINMLSEQLPIMCDVLEIIPEHIGLKTLELNYQTEEGDFSGYIGQSDIYPEVINTKMVLKKSEVFAHEWMHFIDASMGFKNYNVTELMKEDKEIFRLLNLKDTSSFLDVLYSKEEDYSEKTLSEGLLSLSHFIEKYAIDKNNFHKNITDAANNFIINIEKNKMTNENCQKELIKKMQDLLMPNYPPRYFSFMNAQCEIYLNNLNNKKISKNQLLDFSENADRHLKESNYTASVIETFARTFETYFKKLVRQKGTDSKLIARNYDSDLYPQGELMDKTNSYWKKAWEEIKSNLYKETLKLNKQKTYSNIEKIREKTIKRKENHYQIN